MEPVQSADNGPLPETTALAADLIRQNTVDPPGNEFRASALVADLLARNDIQSSVYEIEPGRTNLVARLPGSGEKPGLAFSAHFDTIGVEIEKWSFDPFGGKVVGGHLQGRGAADMKGGMAAMAMAMIHLKRNRVALKGDLVLAFSAAENSSCLGARRLVEDGYLNGIGALLVSEPSSNRPLVSEKGALWLRATASGEYGHNAFSEDRTGDRGNAIVRLARFLDKAHDIHLEAPPHRHLKPPTINVGIIQGGLSTPLVPPQALAELDVRTVPGISTEGVLQAFRAIAGEHIHIELLDFKPPVDTSDDHPFVKLCVEACRSETGYTGGPAGVAYYSDAAVIVPPLGLPMVIVGPGEVGMSGAVDEYVEVEKLEEATRIFTTIATSYLT